jgi:hypothetical protein
VTRRDCVRTSYACAGDLFLKLCAERDGQSSRCNCFSGFGFRHVAAVAHPLFHNLVLQHHNCVNQHFRTRRTAGNINVNRHNFVNALQNSIVIENAARSGASACRGEARKVSAPNLERSFLALTEFIISIAQQAKPNVAGHNEDLRAQLTIASSWTVKTSGKDSTNLFSKPINQLRISNYDFQIL